MLSAFSNARLSATREDVYSEMLEQKQRAAEEQREWKASAGRHQLEGQKKNELVHHLHSHPPFFSASSQGENASERKKQKSPLLSSHTLSAPIGSMPASSTPPSASSAAAEGGGVPATAAAAASAPPPVNGPIATVVDDSALAASAGLPPLSDQAVPLMEGLMYRESTVVPMIVKKRYGVLYS